MPDQSRPLTPGAYIKQRRCFAMLSVRDVAARLATEPRVAEHARADWLELIEADAAPMTLTSVAALRSVFSFDVHVLLQLSALHLGIDVPAPRLCRICACSEQDACVDPVGGVRVNCHWVDEDLCSACGGEPVQAVA